MLDFRISTSISDVSKSNSWKIFILIIILSNNQQCPLPLNLFQSFKLQPSHVPVELVVQNQWSYVWHRTYTSQLLSSSPWPHGYHSTLQRLTLDYAESVNEGRHFAFQGYYFYGLCGLISLKSVISFRGFFKCAIKGCTSRVLLGFVKSHGEFWAKGC